MPSQHKYDYGHKMILQNGIISTWQTLPKLLSNVRSWELSKYKLLLCYICTLRKESNWPFSSFLLLLLLFAKFANSWLELDCLKRLSCMSLILWTMIRLVSPKYYHYTAMPLTERKAKNDPTSTWQPPISQNGKIFAKLETQLTTNHLMTEDRVIWSHQKHIIAKTPFFLLTPVSKMSTPSQEKDKSR